MRMGLGETHISARTAVLLLYPWHLGVNLYPQIPLKSQKTNLSKLRGLTRLIHGFGKLIGAGDGAQTRDLRLGKVMVY